MMFKRKRTANDVIATICKVVLGLVAFAAMVYGALKLYEKYKDKFKKINDCCDEAFDGFDDFDDLGEDLLDDTDEKEDEKEEEKPADAE